MNLILVLCIVVGIITIALFTADQMGFFQGEPKQEIKAEHTCENDPILRVAADYDFCPNSYLNSENELTGLYIEGGQCCCPGGKKSRAYGTVRHYKHL